MVCEFITAELTKSYVRVNQKTSPGIGKSVIGIITRHLAHTDPAVVNASLLHPSMVTPPAEPSPLSVQYWRLRHLCGHHEDLGEGHTEEVWREMTMERTSSPPGETNPRATKSTINAAPRSLTENNTDSPTKDQEMETLREKRNIEEERLEKTMRTLKDPNKLKLLVNKLNRLKKKKRGMNISLGKRSSPVD